ncbi:MAG: M18 family aminopeptidase [Candidatus Cloacimonadaceae bacterium]|nr:M18 family aminopeptidase [Candidatus Cloacimonadaceae bacterium]
MNSYISDFLSFLDASPTSFQASRETRARLETAGYMSIDEGEALNLKPGGKYYICRGETAVIAFCVGSQTPCESGFLLAASHIDSPSLKIKANTLKTENSVSRIGVEVYGGPIIGTWIDRELGIAGKVVVMENGTFTTHLVDLKKPVAVIPNAAIHLNRDINKGFEYNKQIHLQAFLTTNTDAENPLLSAIAEAISTSPEQIVDMELFLYDYAKASLTGIDASMILSGRLDNLAMTHAILSALIAVDKPSSTSVAVFFDHEEIGSQTPQGAFSSLLSEIMERITLAHKCDRDSYFRALRKSFLISADMAHAFHPGYPEKYDPAYAPVMNKGPVIKLNANIRYASTAESSTRFITHCEKAGVNYQKFAVRSDLPCGSTVGPIVAADLGIQTVDIGNPMWAMHSVRETCGVRDHEDLIKVLKSYWNAL